MIVSRTPYRVSLFGGGTDYPAWYREHGGAVFGAAIDKYCRIGVRALPPFFEHRHRIVYSKIELVRRIDEIEHPAVRAVLTDLGHEAGVEIHHDGDLPARSGMGSSSAFTVGLLNAMRALRGAMSDRAQLARDAIRIEQRAIGEAVGSQDQVWAAFGGLNRIDFRRDGEIDVRPVILPEPRRRELNESVMLFFTGLSRVAARIAADKIANLAARADRLKSIASMVDEAMTIALDPRRGLDELGRLMHDSWRLKRELAPSVSTPRLDEIYAAGRDAGAWGGKLLGAGGGGFMLFLAPPEARARIRDRLAPLIHVGCELGAPGSRIVVYEPDSRFAA